MSNPASATTDRSARAVASPPFALAYIGPPLAVAGWRLAGAWTATAENMDAAAVVAEARGQAAVVIISRAIAGALPAADRDAWLAATAPLLLIEPDDDPLAAFEPAERVRRQLGLESVA